ncbi:alpha-L-rhamnosidase C-terminal domain-containing protein [Solirubrobacter soli]|uniref:alpha-L-rhamnosidase C-terminal domain-containing protein n=1 Tax=Solirubrobacter soli TaxID=363832 RepID=UPI00040869EC|nr:alpha-L-rhamnosidase C-terminal domain-containing protein [Solirubrobacter soli]
MKASSAAAWLAVALAGLVAASPAHAQGPVELSRTPIPENAAWKSYVLGTGTADVTPVRIASVSGSVTNAEGLVDASKGPATLTYTAGGQAPVIILDYGREVGGLPFFTAGAVTPATGTSVTLRSAYSETRQFLYTAGNTTLTLPAAAGDTNLKVAGVGNFIVGDTLQIGSQTATISAVGTQARSTTLFAAAAAGATNVKVAATTGLAAGDTLLVDGESVTISAVGTQGRATTLSAATAAGATNVKVASVTGMAAGDPIVVDGESGTIQAVGTSGATGTGVTLAAPLANAHASGAAVQDLGTGVTFAPALTAAHASGAPVIGPGTGITISAPLTAAQPAGTSVRGTPGTLSGDANGFNGVGVAASRAENWVFSAPGTLGNAANAIQGGERFQSLTLTTPGTLQLSAVGIHVRYPNAGASDYVGHFLSSDSKLNKIWYQGAYTNDTNMVPIGAVPNQTIPVILDGAKRDRRPWSGDLDLQGKTMFSSLGFGAKGSDYIKGSIQLFGASQAANGSIFGHIQDWTRNPPAGGFYSLSYSMYYVLNLASYYLYSGDLDFVRSQYAIVQRQMAYNRALVDPTSGLLISNSSERDWDFYDGGKPGAVSAYNAIYYKALTDAAYMASELGNTADAATYAAQAADLKQRINATLFDATRGVYKLADRDNANHPGNSVPQDANAEAISFGIAPASSHTGILSWLRTNLWEPFGPQPYSADANYSTVISPFVTGKELDARFAAGDTQGALDLTHLLWDQMTDANGPWYTGAMWEKLNRDGTDVDANASLSHGWATAPTPALSHYVLGVQPVTAGFRTWRVAPQPGDLQWAQGTVPTPQGPIVSRWARGNGSFTLTVDAPQGTSGTVRVPLFGRSRTIAMDGTVVWQDGAPQGVSAVERDGAVEFSGIAGAHTFAFGTVTTDVPGTVGGSVPATLSLTLGAPASFGPFTPGVAKDYTAATTANVVSTAGDAALSVSDPGHLTNGAFALPEALRVSFSKASWTAPVSNDPVTITFAQHIGATDALRTGAYSKTLTFTLSTTTP